MYEKLLFVCYIGRMNWFCEANLQRKNDFYKNLHDIFMAIGEKTHMSIRMWSRGEADRGAFY